MCFYYHLLSFRPFVSIRAGGGGGGGVASNTVDRIFVDMSKTKYILIWKTITFIFDILIL